MMMAKLMIITTFLQFFSAHANDVEMMHGLSRIRAGVDVGDGAVDGWLKNKKEYLQQSIKQNLQK